MKKELKKSLKNKGKNLKLTTLGFTLIELLAVIIILGILMIIAIPSVTEYILNSRKSAYITTANNYIASVRNKVNSLEYTFTSPGTLYYVPSKCIKLEKGGKSPFGEWEKAYVGVTFDGKSYTYYWTSYDSAGYGIELTKENELKNEVIKTGMNALIDPTSPVNGAVKTATVPDSCDQNLAVTGYIQGYTPIAGTLASNVAIGDFVAYDAGVWDTTVAKPTASEPFTFGGYTAGESKNKSVTCYQTFENEYSGWRVLNISNDIVTLIHAGQSECYYHKVDTDTGYNSERILTGITTGTVNANYISTSRNWSMYINSIYATNATAFTKNMLDVWKGSYVSLSGVIADSLIMTQSHYYFASLYSSSNSERLLRIDNVGQLASTTSSNARGIRLVVTLKAGLLTAGQAPDAFGNNAWKLTL